MHENCVRIPSRARKEARDRRGLRAARRVVALPRRMSAGPAAAFRPLRYYRWALLQVQRLPELEQEYYRQ